ncbi:MAG: DUF1343 domain-containing protein [Sphingobacteriales bacterium]|uniref:exo-beta-N-acetylmuramidase NamZ family protein n=1 Tax=Hydrotalea flava TaxID=714549 RepID=UPI00083384BC|nr:DUF1343 domain-containing protein [Hydrotalea flava]RTL56650.1 MAG: DUF1343 domain-containing protein [Sphingobacteriales bacterium]
MATESGIDVLVRAIPAWKHKRIGFVTNHAAQTKEGIPSRKALLQKQFNIVKLFSPEHGLDVKGADGVLIDNGKDALTGLPIISLYGAKLKPDVADLEDIDLLLFDIPDVGARFYTYLWTLSYVLEAAGDSQKPLIIADRPNPVSGRFDLAEGPMLQTACASFIGRWAMPVRHSCTLGELAQYFNKVLQLNAPLTIVPCKYYDRNSFQPDWETAFVPTSPAIRCFEAALCYTGTAFLEATNISEGRGTPYSFYAAGAPWMNATLVASTINQLLFDNVSAATTCFIPETGKYMGQTCNGIVLKIHHPEKFRPVYTGLILIKLIHDLHPNHFAWQGYVTHVNPTGVNHLDKLLGIPSSENLFESDMESYLQHLHALLNISESWQQTMLPHLLY